VAGESRDPPPYRIESDRLVIRCWAPADAPLLKDAIDTSLDHLRPWMPWAGDEPQPLDEKVELLRRFRGMFDLGQDFVYGIFDRDESEVVGGTGLHTRLGDDAFEIGYWIRSSRLRRGLATETVTALTHVGFAVCEVDRIEIRVDPANEVSSRIPLRLGFVHEATLRRRLAPFGEKIGPRDATVYTMFRTDFEHSPLARARIRAFDGADNRLL
jgi:RimJ/RimL family protein N-acetyltransferase